MTVKELRELISQLPEDMEVWMNLGVEQGMRVEVTNPVHVSDADVGVLNGVSILQLEAVPD